MQYVRSQLPVARNVSVIKSVIAIFSSLHAWTFILHIMRTLILQKIQKTNPTKTKKKNKDEEIQLPTETELSVLKHGWMSHSFLLTIQKNHTSYSV